MGLELGKARSIYVKGSHPQKKGREWKKEKEKSGFAFNSSILDPVTIVLVNKVGWGRGEVNHRNHLLSWTKEMKAFGQAKLVCGFSP